MSWCVRFFIYTHTYIYIHISFWEGFLEGVLRKGFQKGLGLSERGNMPFQRVGSTARLNITQDHIDLQESIYHLFQFVSGEMHRPVFMMSRNGRWGQERGPKKRRDNSHKGQGKMILPRKS